MPRPYRYTGAYLDPTGLYHLKARYYDPNLGRFTQTDPAGKEANPHVFAAAGPINNIDPGGTSLLGCIGGGLSVLGGAISLGAGIASAIGTCGLSTPASLGAIGTGIGLVDPWPGRADLVALWTRAVRAARPGAGQPG